jgi:hypothetical protein
MGQVPGQRMRVAHDALLPFAAPLKLLNTANALKNHGHTQTSHNPGFGFGLAARRPEEDRYRSDRGGVCVKTKIKFCVRYAWAVAVCRWNLDH